MPQLKLATAPSKAAATDEVPNQTARSVSLWREPPQKHDGTVCSDDRAATADCILRQILRFGFVGIPTVWAAWGASTGNVALFPIRDDDMRYAEDRNMQEKHVKTPTCLLL